MKSYVNNLCARSVKVETYKSVLSGQPHLPKVETVKKSALSRQPHLHSFLARGPNVQAVNYNNFNIC